MHHEHVSRRSHDRPDPWTAAGYWGFGVAVFYAVLVRFSQAAGATIGLAGPVNPVVRQRFFWASYEFGVLILLAGAACLMLVRPGLRMIPGWVPVVGGAPVSRPLILLLLVAPTLLGSAYAIAHGIVGEILKTLDLLGIPTMHPPIRFYVAENRTANDLWNIFFYEPWFVILGCCAAMSVVAWARQSRVPGSTIRVASTCFLIFTVTLTVSWVLAAFANFFLTVG